MERYANRTSEDFMIDLHCHIIPWVDDGAENAHIACAMAEHAYRSGVKTIVATPHSNLFGVRGRHSGNYRGRTYTERFSMFRALLKQHHIPIEVLPGSELFAQRSNLRQLLERKQVVTLNHSRYLLAEFDFDSPGSAITAALATISRCGYVPVVAHPERYRCVQENPRLAVEWFAAGYVIQLNKGSILGRLGSGAQRAGVHLLTSGIAHVIASDAHDTYYRPSGFQSLLPVLKRLVPPQYTELLLEKNPRRIILDRPIPVPEKEI